MAKKCAKKRDARAKLLFYFYKLIAFLPFSLPSPSLLSKHPFVVIQKVCYHGNVTSHFPLYSSVICKENKAIREITTLKEVGHKILRVCRIPFRDIDLQ